jgi:hypothetical protein
MSKMQRRSPRAVAALALLLIMGGQITDPFNWDHTFQGGSEIDYTVVVVVAVGATVLLAAGVGLVAWPGERFLNEPTTETDAGQRLALAQLFTLPTASPPSPLRI